jgi:hypothetical protein
MFLCPSHVWIVLSIADIESFPCHFFNGVFSSSHLA